MRLKYEPASEPLHISSTPRKHSMNGVSCPRRGRSQEAAQSEQSVKTSLQAHGGLRTFHRKSTCTDAINLKALCGTHLVALPPGFRRSQEAAQSEQSVKPSLQGAIRRGLLHKSAAPQVPRRARISGS